MGNKSSKKENQFEGKFEGKFEGEAITLLNDKAEDKDKTIAAIIVTFCSGGSYDNLFTSVEQKSIEGTKVQVYQCNSLYITSLSQAFDGKPKTQIEKQLIQSIKGIDSDCVVFNWQCCGSYSNGSCQQGYDKLFKFLKKMIDRGHMCMFSDFSLMTLIKGWEEKYELGPNPFVQTGNFSGHFQIRFTNGILKQCPSAQLQIVGDMAEDGRCMIHAMGGTITYCVDKNKIYNKFYQLEVLTVVPQLKAPSQHLKSKIGQFQGSAGHTLIKYPGKGMILTSMGHWIELMKIDTSEQKLFEVAERQYGSSYANNMRMQYDNMDISEQKAYIQKNATQFVRNQAPCIQKYKKSK